ncbi:MAG: hypothetical protein ACHP6H_03295, partial [Legionellales bacterium]
SLVPDKYKDDDLYSGALGGEIEGWSKEMKQAAEKMSAYDEDAKPFDKVYTMGFNAPEYTLSAEEAWNHSVKDSLPARVASIAGMKADDLMTQKGETMKFYMPCWAYRYQYKGVEYYVLMYGTDATQIDGTRPGQKKPEEVKPVKPKRTGMSLVGLIAWVLCALFFCILVFSLTGSATKAEVVLYMQLCIGSASVGILVFIINRFRA